MVRVLEAACGECSKLGKTRNGTYKCGVWICGHCKRRTSFPNLFKKIYGDIKPAKKKFKKRRRFKREEELILYHKHVKDMSASEFKEHMDKMKGIVAIVKSISRKNKPKPNFKEEFSELTKVRE